MFYLQNGDILPGIGIGGISLGMNIDEVNKIVGDNPTKELANHKVIKCGDVKIWIEKNREIVTQISVFGDFKGTLNKTFGVGSYLSDIETSMDTDAYEKLSVFHLKKYQGICFELEDIDDDWEDVNWFKGNAPIEYISVFPPQ